MKARCVECDTVVDRVIAKPPVVCGKACRMARYRRAQTPPQRMRA